MEKILSYLISERSQKPEIAEKIASPFRMHDDIRTGLENWIEQRVYPQGDTLIVEGYTAKVIFKLAPFMDGVGVYNFLITLRERPDDGHRIISEGFRRK